MKSLIKLLLNMSIQVERQNSSYLSDKTAKYDRQLRLWGNHGQSDLENSRICLINATAVGTETLKSMVLPGIGHFTIIDENAVTDEDIASNFFITIDSIGQNRAKVACTNLSELNPDVSADFLNESIDQILENRPEYLKSFSLVISTNLKENSLKNLSAYLWNENVPLLIIRSYGLVGYIRIIVKEHNVIEPHPDNELPDLRLDQPFDELKSYCNSIELDKLTANEHSHMPHLVILYKYLQIWKSQNDGKIPKSYKEKEKFKELIKTGILKSEDSIAKFEENFEEALKNVNNSICELPEEIRKLFEDEKCLNLNSDSERFWIIVRAIREFTENEGAGQLPLRGTIPDMMSDSDKFVALQNAYRTKAQHDLDAIMTRIERLLLNINKPYDHINEQLVRIYCKNAYYLKSLRYRSLAEEYDPQTSRMAALVDQEPEGDIVFYVLLRAVERFYMEYKRYPGANNDIDLDSDMNLMKKVLGKLLNDNSIALTLKEEYINEICRYGNSEIHSISGFLGGCAAHESIKLITSQFVTFNNTLIYNGIKQTTSIYEL